LQSPFFFQSPNPYGNNLPQNVRCRGLTQAQPLERENKEPAIFVLNAAIKFPVVWKNAIGVK
jgi:hypothetical protein